MYTDYCMPCQYTIQYTSTYFQQISKQTAWSPSPHLQGVVKIKDLDAGSEEVVGQDQLVPRLQELVAGKGERRIVYQPQQQAAQGQEAAAEASG